MSLIYQALQQTADRTGDGTGAGTTPAPETSEAAPGSGPRRTGVMLVALAAVGLLGGVAFGRWNAGYAQRDNPVQAGQSARPNAQPAPEVLRTPAALPSEPLRALPGVSDPPSPLPSALPRQRWVSGLSPAPSQSTTPAPLPAAVRPRNTEIVAEPVPRHEAAAAQAPVAAQQQAPREDLAERFDAMNRALETRDEASAKQHLQAIRSVLPENSVARQRAQAWFAYRTGDLALAQSIYRRLLERLPGDEQASATLAALQASAPAPERVSEARAQSVGHTQDQAASERPGATPPPIATDLLASGDALR